MSNDIAGIYKIENLINGKVYVGQSIHIFRRWREEKQGNINEYVQSSFKKYGLENFSFEVLEEIRADTREELIDKLNQREIFYIKIFDCTNPDKGYNLTFGGEGVVPTEEVRKRISIALKGKNNPMFGKHLSKEIREKLSLVSKRYWKEHPEKNPMKNPENVARVAAAHFKKIICVETGIVYSSLSEAVKKLNLNQGHLSDCLNGRRKTTGGYHFQFA
jgi:group I intron endonuclease